MDEAAGEGGASANNKAVVAVMSVVVVVSSSSVSSLCVARFVFLLAGSPTISNGSNTDVSDDLDEELRLDDLFDFFLDLEDLAVVDVPVFSLRRYAIFLSLLRF